MWSHNCLDLSEAATVGLTLNQQARQLQLKQRKVEQLTHEIATLEPAHLRRVEFHRNQE